MVNAIARIMLGIILRNHIHNEQIRTQIKLGDFIARIS